LKTVKTFTATIYLGLQEGYNGCTHRPEDVRKFLWEASEIGFCVTVTSTEFVYGVPNLTASLGYEPGVAIGVINYPRFPAIAKELEEKTLILASKLKAKFKQNRVSVVFSKHTVLLDSEEEK
jgi:hypothetical protein